MDKYDYLEAVTFDVKYWLLEHYELDFILNSDPNNFYDELFVDDNVTGNASGSYTMNRWKAEENLCHNLSLLVDAANKFGYVGIPSEWIDNAETADVVIRCHLLNDAIANAMEQIREEA